MTVYGLWCGGSSYSNGDPSKDMEVFNSITHAGRVLRHRETHNSGRYPLDTFYVHREREPVCMPAVHGSSMQLFADADGREPIMKLKIGPMGGLIKERK